MPQNLRLYPDQSVLWRERGKDARKNYLKGINPNAVAKSDNRTVEEINQNIENQGRIVEEAMKKLRYIITGSP